jgi:hypothetical protein
MMDLYNSFWLQPSIGLEDRQPTGPRASRVDAIYGNAGSPHQRPPGVLAARAPIGDSPRGILGLRVPVSSVSQFGVFNSLINKILNIYPSASG